MQSGFLNVGNVSAGSLKTGPDLKVTDHFFLSRELLTTSNRSKCRDRRHRNRSRHSPPPKWQQPWFSARTSSRARKTNKMGNAPLRYFCQHLGKTARLKSRVLLQPPKARPLPKEVQE